MSSFKNSSSVCESLTKVIVNDVRRIREWDTSQKVIYMSFNPQPPKDEDILWLVSKKVYKNSGAKVSWNLTENKISASVYI